MQTASAGDGSIRGAYLRDDDAPQSIGNTRIDADQIKLDGRRAEPVDRDVELSLELV